MAKIFILFDKNDTDWKLVKNYVDSLAERDHTIVYTDTTPSPGDPWRGELHKNLSECDVTIPMITPRSVRSELFVSEVSAAMAYVAEHGRGAVIPVIFENAMIPQALRKINGIFADENNLSHTLTKIDRTIAFIFARQLARDEKRESKRKKIESTAADYIEKSQDELRSRETRYQRLGHFWYGAAYVALLSGVGAAIWRSILLHDRAGDWPRVAELAISGLILVGLIIAVAKFSFTLGRSFMVESLKNADRSHAISFGEFYLNAFSENLEWSEVKEAFEHWNIDRGSTFLSQSTEEFDPRILEKAVEIAKVISKSDGNRTSK